METALEGVRILDLSQYLAGPYATMLLGDLGAEIIKVEPVDLSPEVRRLEPLKTCDEQAAGIMIVNRNKKSIALNLKHPEGKAIFYGLVNISDVVFDNFRPGALARLGADYDTLKALNPRIISCSTTAFGSTGPMSQQPAFDGVLQAMSGWMSLTGIPGEGPMPVGMALADLSSGIYSAHGILAALVARGRTGVGQRVETSLLATTLAFQLFDAAGYLLLGTLPEQRGRTNFPYGIYGTFKTQDDYIMVAGHRSFEKICRLLGRTDLVQDPRFDTYEKRRKNVKTLLSAIKPLFRQKTTAEWLTLLKAEDIPCSPVNTLDKTFSDPQVLDQQMVATFDYVLGGKMRGVGNPIRMSATPEEKKNKFFSPPVVGQHTTEILTRLLDYPREKIEALKQKRIILQADMGRAEDDRAKSGDPGMMAEGAGTRVAPS